MNIFYLDYKTEKSVQYLHDKHVVKMCLEITQILCSALYFILEYNKKYPLEWLRIKNKEQRKINQNKYKKETGLCLPTHENHPCCLWAKYIPSTHWLLDYLRHLLFEYYYRFHKQHKCLKVYNNILKELRKLDISKLLDKFLTTKKFIDPPQCMPDKYKQEDTVRAYRDYYVAEKIFDNNGNVMKWTKRGSPDWIISQCCNSIAFIGRHDNIFICSDCAEECKVQAYKKININNKEEK